MARRKTIDDIRNELRLEKDKTRKLRRALAQAEARVWVRAAAIMEGVAANYPEAIFGTPGPDAGPEIYSAAGVRLAAKIITEECMRRAKELK